MQRVRPNRDTQTEARDREAQNREVPPARHNAPEEICTYCGTERIGTYCETCGQKFRDRPLTLRELGKLFARGFLDVEEGLLFTARHALLDPGGLARRYLDGETRRFMSPIAYLLVCVTVAFGIYWVVKDRYIQFIVEFVNSPMVNPRGLSEDEVIQDLTVFGITTLQEYGEFMFALQTQYLTPLMLFTMIPSAIGLRLLFSERTFAETLVQQLYVMGQYTVYNAVLLATSALFQSIWLMGLSFVAQIVMQAWGAAGLYGRSWKNAVFGVLATVLATLAIGLLFGGLVFVAGLAWTAFAPA